MPPKATSRLKPLVLVAIAIILLGFSVWRTQQRIEQTHPRACIIDALSELPTDTDFTEEATQLLQSNGYKVTTIEGEEVTVEALAGLQGYDVVVFRVHSGVFEDDIWFFTGEPFDGSKYVLEQLSGEVHIATCPSSDGLLFAVGSRFVEHYLVGLDGSLVVLMGCDGLTGTDLGESFIDVGAVGVVGWDGPVTIDASDRVVLGFLGGYLGGGAFVGGVSGDVFNVSLVFFGD